jgi:hypothetical protein
MIPLATLLCNYGRGFCLIDIGTEGIWIEVAVSKLRLRLFPDWRIPTSSRSLTTVMTMGDPSWSWSSVSGETWPVSTYGPIHY